jgi:PHS family inorganic phosphate transporter-like MFS transporter
MNIENNNNIIEENHKLKFISSCITRISNFSVQYNYQALSVSLLVMTVEVCTTSTSKCKLGRQETWINSAATATVFVGSITGELTMGYLGDVIGRSAAMSLTLTLAAISSILCGFLPTGSANSIYLTIIIIRFFLGIGLGGVYPLAATKAAENNQTHIANPRSSARSFFWQTPGSLFPWILILVFTATPMSTDIKWRLLLALGALPSIIVVILDCYESYEREKLEREQHNIDETSVNNSRGIYQLLSHDSIIWYKLIGTGGGWFVFDLCYYGVGLFGGVIISDMTKSITDVTTPANITNIAWKQLLALSMGIPAVLITIHLFDRFSFKQLQIAGFLLFIIAFIIMALSFAPLRQSNPTGLYILYCFLLFCLQFGPNVTTFVMPAAIYRKEVRSTMNGISAACGKLGAVTGVYLFGTIATISSFPIVMILCAILSLIGAIITYIFIPEPHEDVEHENYPGRNENVPSEVEQSALQPTHIYSARNINRFYK